MSEVLRLVMTFLGLPLLAPYLFSDREVVRIDAARWLFERRVFGAAPRKKEATVLEVIALAARYPEFRTLLYYRAKHGGPLGQLVGLACSVLYRGAPALQISVGSIGPGFYIEHGFATVVFAESIGAEFWVNQQVTIGANKTAACPVIGDNVTIRAGAKVLGGVTLGRGATIGANAVVLRDVPSGATAVGVPARILER